MKHIISTLVVAALAAVGMVEAKPEMPVRPIEVKVEGKKPMPKFDGKRHGYKHHARPHRCHKHGVRHMKRHHRKPMMSAPIVRPVRKACPAIKCVK